MKRDMHYGTKSLKELIECHAHEAGRADRKDKETTQKAIVCEVYARVKNTFDMVVTFRDSDRLNCDIDNLILVTKGENCTLTRLGLRSEDPDLTEAGLAVVRLKQAVSRKRREKRKGGGAGEGTE